MEGLGKEVVGARDDVVAVVAVGGGGGESEGEGEGEGHPTMRLFFGLAISGLKLPNRTAYLRVGRQQPHRNDVFGWVCIRRPPHPHNSSTMEQVRNKSLQETRIFLGKYPNWAAKQRRSASTSCMHLLYY